MLAVFDRSNPLYREHRISLAWLADSLGVNHSTVYRWVTLGVDGCKLEAFRLGKKRFTTHEAYSRFLKVTNYADRKTGGKWKSQEARNGIRCNVGNPSPARECMGSVPIMGRS